MVVETHSLQGGYICTWLWHRRSEIIDTLSEKRWKIEPGYSWISGPWVRRGNHLHSLEDPSATFTLKESLMMSHLQMLGGRPVYHTCGMVRDAVSNKELFPLDDWYRECDAGIFYKAGTELRFTDGREHLRICDDIYRYYDVDVARVLESEYSLRVGCPESGYRYYLLDVASWTCNSI